MDLYHGTYAESLPEILAGGFKPVMGAGGTTLLFQYGMEVPGVYLAESLTVATSYPMTPTTGRVTVSVDGTTLTATGAPSADVDAWTTPNEPRPMDRMRLGGTIDMWQAERCGGAIVAPEQALAGVAAISRGGSS